MMSSNWISKKAKNESGFVTYIVINALIGKKNPIQISHGMLIPIPIQNRFGKMKQFIIINSKMLFLFQFWKGFNTATI